MSPAGKVTVYDPTADPKSTGVGLAPRLDSLKGKRAGILDNSKANAGILMLAVVARLKEKLRRPDVVKREKGMAGPPSPRGLAELARATSSWSAAPTEGRARRGVSTAQSCWKSGAFPPSSSGPTSSSAGPAGVEEPRRAPTCPWPS